MKYPFKGAFLQISNTHADNSELELWRESISAMKLLKMDLVIIQTEAYVDADGRRDEVRRDYITGAIEHAEKLGMKVWVGLAYPKGCVGSTSCVRNEERIDKVISQSNYSADLIWDEWSAFNAFDGFYLSSEGWTPQHQDELGYLKKYLIKVSEHCREKDERLQIATSPFINKHTPEKTGITEDVYKSFLGETFLTVLMLQDGVGGHNVPLDVVPAYMNAMKRACDDAGIEMWVNIESFVNTNRSATFDRLQEQIATAHEVTDKLVTFEFFKYWTNFLNTAGAAELNAAYYQTYIRNK